MHKSSELIKCTMAKGNLSRLCQLFHASGCDTTHCSRFWSCWKLPASPLWFLEADFPQWSWSDFFPADIFPHAHSRSNRCFLCPSHPNIELNFEQYCSCMAAAWPKSEISQKHTKHTVCSIMLWLGLESNICSQTRRLSLWSRWHTRHVSKYPT